MARPRRNALRADRDAGAGSRPYAVGEASAASLEAEAIPFRRLTADDIARDFPLIDGRKIRFAMHLEFGGALFAGRIVDALARWARRQGNVRLVEETQVRDVDPDRARLRLADGAVIDADAVIVAAGPWAPRLVPGLSARVTPSRQLVIYLDPPAETMEAWARHPMILDIDPAAGFYLVPPRAGTGLKVGNHGFTLTGDPDRDRAAARRRRGRSWRCAASASATWVRYRIAEAKTCFSRRPAAGALHRRAARRPGLGDERVFGTRLQIRPGAGARTGPRRRRLGRCREGGELGLRRARRINPSPNLRKSQAYSALLWHAQKAIPHCSNRIAFLCCIALYSPVHESTVREGPPKHLNKEACHAVTC